MVDYSKWDHFGSDSDSETVASSKINVQRFQEPTSVTFGGQQRKDAHSTTATTPTMSSSSISVSTESSPKDLLSKLAHDFQQVSREELYKNGNDCKTYCWTQRADEVDLFVLLSNFVGLHVKGRDVKVTVSKSGTVRLRLVKDSEPFFKKQLARDTWDSPFTTTHLKNLEEKKDLEAVYAWDKVTNMNWLLADVQKREDYKLDWGIVNMTLRNGEEKDSKEVHERVLKITMKKLFPVEKLRAEWWDKCFVDEDVIDVELVRERVLNDHQRKRSKKFTEAWKQANAQFKAKTRATTSVDSEKPITKQLLHADGS